MTKRCAELLDGHECSHIQFEVAFGKPAKEIQEVATRNQAKLIVFGHHHFFHRESLSLGRMPWKSMLDNQCGILVVNP